MDGTFRPNASELRADVLVPPPRVESRWKAEGWIEKSLIAGLIGGVFVQAGFVLLSP